MIENPIITQDKVFHKLIQTAKDTKFGIEHSFDKIKDYNDYKEIVPDRKYEELFPYINEIRKGKKNILWPNSIKLFAKSSGTTNAKSKYIPLSYETLNECHFKGGKDMLAIYFFRSP